MKCVDYALWVGVVFGPTRTLRLSFFYLHELPTVTITSSWQPIICKRSIHSFDAVAFDVLSVGLEATGAGVDVGNMEAKTWYFDDALPGERLTITQ